MFASLRALLINAIDYAGSFPPANLSLDEAVTRYSQYRAAAESWMLARFVCAARRLGELEVAGDFQWCIAAVAPPTVSAEQFLSQQHKDLQAIAALQATRGDRVRIELFEAPLPKQIVESGSDREIRSFVQAVADQFSCQPLGISAALFEAAVTKVWWQRTAAIAAALSTANQTLLSGPDLPQLGLKLRMGGADSSSCPASQQVASVISTCRDAQLYWKATAGLHQPLRHVDAKTGAAAHGFVNLVAATVMASVHRLSQLQITQIVDDPLAANFVFRDDAFTWKRWHATTQQIRQVRRESFLSFGSCSFDEPREGLCTLGWW